MATLTILATSALVAATACSCVFVGCRFFPHPQSSSQGSRTARVSCCAPVCCCLVREDRLAVSDPDIRYSSGTTAQCLSCMFEKHGLHFSETYLTVYRDGRFYLARDDRSLFQYAFQRGVASGDITGDCDLLFNRLAHSPPEFSGSHVSSYVPHRAWNSDRWYIYVGGSAGEGPLVWTQRSCPTTYFAYFMGVRSCHKNAW